MSEHGPGRDGLRLGLRENWRQFTLLVVINGFVGAMVGLERTVVPLIARQEFGIVSHTVTLSFIVSFGIVKAVANLLAGGLGDRIGRKRLLVAGWLIGLPVPVMIILAPSWGWVVAANVLLGLNQGLCWSATVIMKIDLVGPRRRGLAMGLNESAGYVAVSGAALATGYIASVSSLRPQPFLLGIAFAVLGLILSVAFAEETRGHAALEADRRQGADGAGSHERGLSFASVFALTSWRDRALFSASQAGFVNNMNDGMVWGVLPIFLASAGLGVERIGVVAAVYPAVWGFGQLATGGLSDRWGRKWLIVAGLWVQAAGILMVVAVGTFVAWVVAAVLMGLGTALVYPTLLSAVSDVAHPAWRGSAIGVYRLWRDSGYAVGALVSGAIADLLGMGWSIGMIGAATAVSGLIVALRMYETLTLPADETARNGRARSGATLGPESRPHAELAQADDRAHHRDACLNRRRFGSATDNTPRPSPDTPAARPRPPT